MVDALRTKDVELIAFNYDECFPDRTVTVSKYQKKVVVDGVMFIKHASGGSYLWNKIFRRSAIGGNRFIDGIFHIEDMCFNLHVIIQLSKIVCLPVIGYVYHRDNNNSISHTNNPQTRIIANEDSLKVYQSASRPSPGIFPESSARSLRLVSISISLLISTPFSGSTTDER